jgi:hypothetical protein
MRKSCLLSNDRAHSKPCCRLSGALVSSQAKPRPMHAKQSSPLGVFVLAMGYLANQGMESGPFEAALARSLEILNLTRA